MIDFPITLDDKINRLIQSAGYVLGKAAGYTRRHNAPTMPDQVKEYERMGLISALAGLRDDAELLQRHLNGEPHEVVVVSRPEPQSPEGTP